MSTLVTVQGIGMTYVRPRLDSVVKAIDQVDLTIEEGEFVSLVGPSGCGKTTLLRLIDGQIAPTEGSITLDGVPLKDALRERAMVFQEPSLFPWFTVARNVGYGLECRGVPPKEAIRRAEENLNLVGLSGWGSHYPGELSGGMQQRVNLARALCVDAQLLLMDEPFSALDAQTREMMQHELLKIWEQARRTVLFVTHQINEAIYLSDRVIVMSGHPGRVVADITIRIPRPRDLSVKRTQEFLALEDQIWGLIVGQVLEDFEPDGLD